jgi:hypothetical protein
MSDSPARFEDLCLDAVDAQDQGRFMITTR